MYLIIKNIFNKVIKFQQVLNNNNNNNNNNYNNNNNNNNKGIKQIF